MKIIFRDENGKTHAEKRYTISSETKIRKDGSSMSYIEFVDDILKNLEGTEVEFKGTVDYENNHIEYISFSSDILEPEKDSVEETEEEGTDSVETTEDSEETETTETTEETADSEVVEEETAETTEETDSAE